MQLTVSLNFGFSLIKFISINGRGYFIAKQHILNQVKLNTCSRVPVGQGIQILLLLLVSYNVTQSTHIFNFFIMLFINLKYAAHFLIYLYRFNYSQINKFHSNTFGDLQLRAVYILGVVFSTCIVGQLSRKSNNITCKHSALYRYIRFAWTLHYIDYKKHSIDMWSSITTFR